MPTNDEVQTFCKNSRYLRILETRPLFYKYELQNPSSPIVTSLASTLPSSSPCHRRPRTTRPSPTTSTRSNRMPATTSSPRRWTPTRRIPRRRPCFGGSPSARATPSKTVTGTIRPPPRMPGSGPPPPRQRARSSRRCLLLPSCPPHPRCFYVVAADGPSPLVLGSGAGAALFLYKEDNDDNKARGDEGPSPLPR